MSDTCDVFVIGAGPAGTEAALSAAACGLRVVLVDEAPAAGGQVYRAPPSTFAGLPATPESRAGDALRHRLAESTVDVRFGHVVWSVSPDLRVDALAKDGPVSWNARKIIVATGAQERVVPFPGWTLPGIIGLAGATILLKSQRILPGRRTLVAGQGPLLLAVAAGILKAGGTVAGVVDLASRGEWLAKSPAFLTRPDLAARGAGWLTRLHGAGVPFFYRHAIRRAVKQDENEIEVTIGPVDRSGCSIAGNERTFIVDAVAVGNGLVASTDITRLLRADHAFDEARGGWAPRIDADFRTSIAGLYTVGDGTGIAGAAAAALNGRLAGLVAARDLGALSGEAYEEKSAPLRRSAKWALGFGGAMAGLMALRPGQIKSIAEDAVVCRCEDVTRRDIDLAFADGARSANQFKAWTRCGMGPCQGRICGDIASALLAQATGQHPRSGMFTGRTPFRPLPLAQLLEPVDYSELKLPPPAPL
ncbi:NAD(P)/FAD-dependent oxidoreductase [Rhizobium rhizogenes]|uniref:NAD(P)/FAD-dependent oxidoreductase n=1 Tax=Rhizobium rhizogenes TaxID=359 RepID=UPI001574121A|nr:NAD(P)/FAD-dependent oxidoreductase [Rhizobium rhizogenes]NTH20667.1 FAD-dependent oxidoreductase [Rhizobium rhizogenes]NTH33676.1 FAD-dependent oxidoreductase [Rhizobium rhizogenes]